MKTCGLVCQKKVNGKTSISIEKDKCITFLSEYEVSNVKITMSKISIVVDNKSTRMNMIFIRIGTKSSYSYTKATTQLNHHILPPIIKMRQLSHKFLNTISTYILERRY